jgi:hypothetical protein
MLGTCLALAFLDAFAYQSLVGSFEDTQYLWGPVWNVSGEEGSLSSEGRPPHVLPNAEQFGLKPFATPACPGVPGPCEPARPAGTAFE